MEIGLNLKQACTIIIEMYL